jgi:two-component system, OmpR family, sensor histidine kinase KdpD
MAASQEHEPVTSISARIEVVQATDLLDEPVPTQRRDPRTLPRNRQVAGLVCAALGLPLLTLAVRAMDDALSLEGQVLLYLAAVVVVAVVGGIVAAIPAAVAAALLIDFFFVAPVHTLDVQHADQAVSLALFVIVAGVVSGLVELAARRARAAERAAGQAETLSALAGADLDEADTLHGILDRARRTFEMESVTLLVRDRSTGDWSEAERAGWSPPGKEAPMQFDVPIGRELRLIGRGPPQFAEDQRVLHAFAAASETAYEGRRLNEQARHARELAAVDRQRTALLAAVGHDLRTPLAGIKAAVSSLRQHDIAWSDVDRDELLATIEQSADRLDAVVANLLDASRLDAGALTAQPRPVALDAVVAAAVLAVPSAAGRVEIDIADDLPLVQADPGLLERILANLIDNALRHAGDDGPVQITAAAGAESAKLAVIDHGPGVSPDQRERMFRPFQRLDDHGPGAGVGLGLSVARRFAEAMDGALAADESPGGGLTMRLRLPLATSQSLTNAPR